MSTITIN